MLPPQLRRMLACCLVAVALGGSADARAADAASEYRFRVEVPALEAIPEADGTIALRLQGFDTPEMRPGAPDIPSKIVRVAIPEGVVPRLVVGAVEDSVRPGLRPRPAATAIDDLPSEDPIPGRAPSSASRRLLRRPDPQYYEPGGARPGPLAWLGATGVFRDQRYVEVHIAPVRFDPVIGALRVATALELTVVFDDDAHRRSAPKLDPRFEAVYRTSFINYAQGTTFRLSTARSDSPAAASPAAPLAGPLYRIRVRQNGVVRLDNTRMNGTGFQAEPLATWKLTSRGVEVPLEINDVNTNGLMDAGDWVQFYGQALDDEPKTILNTDSPGAAPDLFEARDFTDENIYFLQVETGTRSRIGATASAPTFTRTPPADFEAIAHAETDSPTGFRPLGAADPWYWVPTQSNPSQSGLVPSRTENIALPGLASGTAPARVLVRLRGVTEDSGTPSDHKSRITFKNSGAAILATNDDDGSFDGRMIFTHDFTWTFPGSGPQLTEPAQVTIDARPVAAGPNYFNQLILDWIEIRYRRTFQASGDVLTFDWPDGDAEFIVTGLSSASLEAWEITGRVPTSGIVNAVRLTAPAITGAGPFTARFRMDNDPTIPDGTLRRIVVFGPGAVLIPANPDFQSDTVSDLRLNSNQADLIVIAHPTVLGAASQTSLNQLLSYHASKGITSKIAMIQDVQDEFNDGLPGPLAIRSFLRWVTSTAPGEGWADPKPAFVLLLGDGSYDYKGGTAQGNFVPTQILFRDDISLGHYASDNVMAAV
ncbi:MAG TPA: C25 family cysteine peptidase, partial [Candidatus Polarisedimenticolaceae bacterium]|nr:C25 family cysteine peptidase [Candidatus Polarisedimenticolaceae bacterium]